MDKLINIGCISATHTLHLHGVGHDIYSLQCVLSMVCTNMN